MAATRNAQDWRLMAVFYLVLAVELLFNKGKEKIMKNYLFAQLALVILLGSLLVAACDAPMPEPTVTSVPTETPIPPSETPTLEPTATNTPTQTLLPSRGVITIKPPANPKEYAYTGGLISMPLAALTEGQLNRLVQNTLNEDSFSLCPEIWMEPMPDAEVPTYGLFINASPDDHDKGFVVIIRSTVPEANPGGTIGMGTINPDTGGKSLVAAGYEPVEGKPNPDELEIQLVFPGCEVYTDTVKWPG